MRESLPVIDNLLRCPIVLDVGAGVLYLCQCFQCRAALALRFQGKAHEYLGCRKVLPHVVAGFTEKIRKKRIQGVRLC